MLDLAGSSRQRHRLVHDLAGDRKHRAHACGRPSRCVRCRPIIGATTAARSALVTVPFVLPTVVVAGAFTELFAVAGLDDGAFGFVTPSGRS